MIVTVTFSDTGVIVSSPSTTTNSTSAKFVFVFVKSLEAITLTPNATIYLCANIDLSKPNGQRGSFVQRTASNMMSENINSSGTQRDLLLYTINTSSNGVTSVVDKRVIRGDGNGVSGIGFYCLSRAEYDAIPVKDNNTLYFITE